MTPGRARLAGESGQAMLITILMMFLLTALGLGLVGVVVSESQSSGQVKTQDGAYQAAEAGIDHYLALMLNDNQYYAQYVDPAEATRQSGSNATVGPSGDCTNTDSTTGAVWPDAVAWTYPSTPAWTYPNGKDNWCTLSSGYEYDLEITPPSASQPAVTIVSTGQLVGSTSTSTERVIQVLVQPSSVAQFEQIVDNDVGFSANTNGKVWAAGYINYSSGTAAANLYACGGVGGDGTHDYYSSNAFPTMTNGAQTYAGSTAVTNAGLSCPPPFSTFLAPVSALASAAQSSGIYLNDATKAAWNLTFLSNGTVQVQSCSSNGESSTTAPTCTSYTPTGCTAGICNVPSNGAIYAVQNAIVSGTVKGRVTVASNADIVVSNVLGPVTAGTDVIGLIASNNLVFACYTCNSSTTFNFQAAAITQNGIFETSSAFGTGAMGHFSWTGSETDYSGGSMGGFIAPRSYSYDSTLQYLPPPWFPSVGTPYTIQLYREIPAT